jgi:hypothetical protein
MKALALAALAIPMVTAPALAGPYVSTKSEFKFSDDNYKEAVNQARLGYEWKVGAAKPYVELGGGAKTPDGGASKGFTAAEIGSALKLTEKLSAKAKAEFINTSTATDWKVEIGTKYKF